MAAVDAADEPDWLRRDGDGQETGWCVVNDPFGLGPYEPDLSAVNPYEPDLSYDPLTRPSRPVNPDKPTSKRVPKPATPVRKPGGHWRWDSTYRDYVQQRGDQVLLYSEYQSCGSGPEFRSPVASERCSFSNHGPLGHSSDTPSVKDLVIGDGNRAAKILDSGTKHGSDTMESVRSLKDLYRPASPQIMASPTTPPRPPAKLYEEALDPLFRIVDKPKRFFSLGRIFKVAWFEPLGQQNPTAPSDLDWTAACPPFHEERPYAKFRWFVVVRKRLHHSLCLSITTFGGKGATKPSRGRSKDFVVLYPYTIEPPDSFPEEGITRRPIAVIIEASELLLAPTARLDCARIYTVEDNVKVMKIGRVHPESLDDLEEYYKESVS